MVDSGTRRVAVVGCLVLVLGSVLAATPAAGLAGGQVGQDVAVEPPLEVRDLILPLSHYDDEDSSDPPTARINATRNGSVGEEFAFDARRSVDDDGLRAYVWHFGDGSTANGSQVWHIYNRAGNYTARLLLIDSDGNTDTATVDVTVTGAGESSSTTTPAPEQTRSVPCETGNQPEAVLCERAEATATTGDAVTYSFENVSVDEIRFSNGAPDRVTVWDLDSLPAGIDEPRTRSVLTPVTVAAPAAALKQDARLTMTTSLSNHPAVEAKSVAISRWTGDRWQPLPTSVEYRGSALVLTATPAGNGTYAATGLEPPSTAASSSTTTNVERFGWDRSGIGLGGSLVLGGLLAVVAGAGGILVLTVRDTG
jgi:PKD repeat protein